jgi:hypothetical protein
LDNRTITGRGFALEGSDALSAVFCSRLGDWRRDLYRDKQPRTNARVAEIFLLWLLVICVGVASVLTFIADAFFADQMAASLGWPAGNPFQSLVAVANLSVGVLGILCYWIRGNFWVATVIGFSIWWLGAGAVHIREIVVSANYAPNNAGATPYMNILVPIVLIALLTYGKRAGRDERERIGARG